MLRRLLALVAVFGLAGALAATPLRDWTQAVGRTSAGAVVVGNPAARVKLVEYLSYTCPHCAVFTAGSAPVLRARWVRSGSTSIEYRPAVREPLDLAAVLLARCSGARFPAVHDAIFAQQADWYARGADYAQANGARLNLYPTLSRLRAMADGAGLTDIARTTGGLSREAVDACFATDADLNRVLALANDASGQITATPSFALNGKFLGPGSWATLEPQLRAAGAR